MPQLPPAFCNLPRRLLALAAWLLAGLCLLLAAPPPAFAAGAAKPQRATPGIARPPRPDGAANQTGKSTIPALTLPESVYLGLRTNRAIRNAAIERVAQRFDLRVAEDQFTPRLSLQANVQTSRIDSVPGQDAEIMPALSWRLPTGGLVGFTWASTAWQNAAGASGRATAGQLSFSQPLLRGAGSAVTLAPLHSARLQEAINKWRQRATLAETITQIILHHRELIRLQEQQQLAQAALARARKLIEVSRALIEAGRLARMDLVQIEADVAAQEVALIDIANQVEAARIRLLTLLAVDLSSPVTARERLDIRPVALALPAALQTAYRMRPDHNIQRLQVEQARLGIVVARNETLWDLSVFANATLGLRESRTAGWGPERRRISDATLGIRLTAPLNDLAPEQGLVRAQVTLSSLQLGAESLKQGIEGQVRGAVRDIEARWRQWELAGQSLDLARQALDVEIEKLRAGRSSNFQVLSFEARLREAGNARLNATIAYLNALTLLDLQLGTTLATWRVELAE